MRIGIVFLVVATLAAALSFQAPSASSPDATTFEVDPVHSAVFFRINHLGVSNFYGRFDKVSGSFTVGGDEGSVEIRIDAASVNTGNDKRDGHVRSDDFLGAAQFPAITFKGALSSSDGKHYEAKGTLTFRGKSKPVTAKLERIGTKDAMGGLRTGFDGSFTIQRSDFGADYGLDKGVLGDDVKLMFGIEGLAKK